MGNVRPKLIAYTTNTQNPPKEFEGYRVTFSNPTFFAVVPPKGKYDYFYVECKEQLEKEIRATFKIKDPDVKEFKKEDKPVAKSKAIETEVKKEVEKESEVAVEDETGEEQVIPEDLSELTWPELKSLASKFTDKKSFKKDEAIEILEAARIK